MNNKKLLIYRIIYSLLIVASITITTLLICFYNYTIYTKEYIIPVKMIYWIILIAILLALVLIIIFTMIYKHKNKEIKYDNAKTKKQNTTIEKKIKLNKQKLKVKLTVCEKLLKELKLKRILYYVFLSITLVFLLIETIIMSTIIFSMFAYPLIIPTVTFAIITIILNKEIRNIKFQLNLNEIINQDSNN